jgi:transposase
MKDSELYAQLLGLQAPWQVARVELDVPTQEVRVYVEPEATAVLCCALCGQPCALCQV